MKPSENYLDHLILEAQSASMGLSSSLDRHKLPNGLNSCLTCFALVHESQLSEHFMWHVDRGEISL